MDAFSPAHQPDEGYSEDPLHPTKSYQLFISLSTLKSPSELPSWISANASHLPMSLKKGTLTHASLASFVWAGPLTDLQSLPWHFSASFPPLPSPILFTS